MTLIIRKTLFALGVFCFFFTVQTSAQPSFPKNPEDAALIYTDLIHFMEALQHMETNTDTIEVLKTQYFEQGSEGLNEFINRHQLTPELLKNALTKYPERYALIPDFITNISEIQKEYTQLLIEYQAVLPNAMFAPTYLIVGANRGIGQASRVGQLITITRVADDFDKFKKIIAHELSHFQQAITMGGQKYQALYSIPNNMLGYFLREGGAEFVASLVVGSITQTKALAYLDKDENNLKLKFLADSKTQNKDFWLNGTSGQNSSPNLLGYAIGYKICKQHYDQASDKSEAIQHILMMDDAEYFLKYSGYFSY